MVTNPPANPEEIFTYGSPQLKFGESVIQLTTRSVLSVGSAA